MNFQKRKKGEELYNMGFHFMGVGLSLNWKESIKLIIPSFHSLKG